MCVIVWPLEPSEEGILCYQCTEDVAVQWIVKYEVVILFEAIDCVEIYQGISYFWIITVDTHVVQCVWNWLIMDHLDRTD